MGEGLALSWAEDMGIKKKALRETYRMLIEAETEEADCFLHLVSHQCFPYVRVLIGSCANWKIHAHCKAHSDIGLRAILACWSINNGCRTWIKIKWNQIYSFDSRTVFQPRRQTIVPQNTQWTTHWNFLHISASLGPCTLWILWRLQLDETGRANDGPESKVYAGIHLSLLSSDAQLLSTPYTSPGRSTTTSIIIIHLHPSNEPAPNLQKNCMCAGLKDFQSIFVEASFIMLHHASSHGRHFLHNV